MQVEVHVAFAPAFVVELGFELRAFGCELGQRFAVEVQVQLDFSGQVRLDFFGCHALQLFVLVRLAFVGVEVVV